MTSTTTISPSALQLDVGREQLVTSCVVSSGIKREASSSYDELESPSPSRVRKPMRKRAKTQEEKEERAQERIMRNRAAAQVSRERKREHMVALEEENDELKHKVRSLAQDNGKLRNDIESLTQRLEQMEKMLAFFTAPGTASISEQINEQQTTEPVLSNTSTIPNTYYPPTPPGTIRPLDILSNPSTPLLESIDSRNPAVIVNGPQRRISMRFPWNLSSRSPIYRQMVSIQSFWTTILRITTSRAFMNHISISLLMHCAPSQRQSLLRALDRWRFTATGQDALARQVAGELPLLMEQMDVWLKDCPGAEHVGLDGKTQVWQY